MTRLYKVVLIIESSRAYGRGLLLGITRYASMYGPWAFFNEPEEHENSLKFLKEWKPDGIIANISHVESMSHYFPADVPVIGIAGKELIPGIPNIVDDAQQIGILAAKHLFDCGFKNFAYCSFEDMQWSRNRCESFETCVKDSGGSIYSHKCKLSRLRKAWKQNQESLLRWLEKLPKPIAILACNDDRAKHIIEACKILNIHIPTQVALLGIDNDELLCNMVHPSLSSIAINTEKAGFDAAALLHRMMAGKTADDVKIIAHPTAVVVRQSTNILMVDDKIVAAAIHFIRDNSKKMLQVSDVAEYVKMPRRSLERRFRSACNRSILSEIRRHRVEKITKMLLETNFSLEKIAADLNFPSAENISRYFRSETGIAATAFRQKYGRV